MIIESNTSIKIAAMGGASDQQKLYDLLYPYYKYSSGYIIAPAGRYKIENYWSVYASETRKYFSFQDIDIQGTIFKEVCIWLSDP